MDLTGKTVLITGASSGIGKALALKLAKEKCNLILIARRKEKLTEIENEIGDNSVKILSVKCDVSRKEEVISSYKKMKQSFPQIDIAILNAGISRTITPENFNSDLAHEAYGVNLFGIIYWVELLMPEFIKRKNGTIVGVSSLADNRGYSGSGFYSSSKAAVTNFLEGLRSDLRRHNIKVVTLKPGFVKTDMTSDNKYFMPFILSPESAAKIIVKGLKKEKRLIQFPLRLVLLTKIVGAIPSGIYEYFLFKLSKRHGK